VNQQTNPHNEPSEKPRIYGVIGVAWLDGKFLAIKRSPWVKAPGCWCFPGGGIETGESETAALFREIQEELGVDCEIVGKLWQSVTPWNVALAWWQIVLPNTKLQLQAEEVSEAVWLTPAELLAKEQLLESNRDFLSAWASGEFEMTI